MAQKPESAKGFVPQKGRWQVERSFAWLNFFRRLSKDYERTTASAVAFIQLAFISIILARMPYIIFKHALNGTNGAIPSGVFIEKEIAEQWIAENQFTGLLTKYPVNEGLYDWAVANGYFTPKREDHKSSYFKQTFTCASLEHYHYENGKQD
ncbi:transposase [Rhodocytophaga aerolata]|uniref:Transposase n=1 Tax=Rhodocytophaga aerolata TaxID=455078 RepID=A0ABT8R3L9_9BACT|nr:transposase [Rhodocytophaga aerolata]MDO1446702.1 transposase [Rhodocytophaga aerolata]